VPATSIDTFFACMIMVTVALIAMAFLGNTLGAQINSTKDVNKQSYLEAIANHLVNNAGTPSDWGVRTSVPSDMGLAASIYTMPYELDIDKVSRLNSQNQNNLTYYQLSDASKLSDIALGISISQMMSVSIQRTESHFVGSQVNCTFAVSTSLNSEPTNASLHGYLVANGELSEATNQSFSTGVGTLNFQVPSNASQNALLIVFARANFDDRLTAYAIYDFASSQQQSTPTSDYASLSPQNYTLTVTPKVSGLNVNGGYAFTFKNEQNITLTSGNQYRIPRLLDSSPIVSVVFGTYSGDIFTQWTPYPLVPLNAGSAFEGAAKNVFTYTVTINGVLYRLQVNLGDVTT
jgi:hypothetical protein